MNKLVHFEICTTVIEIIYSGNILILTLYFFRFSVKKGAMYIII